ncbi:MAG: isochorismatase family protein [Ruminococcus sp.]|nr:isochorismatase family protein [Ruminococcus sp.]
MDKVLFVVDMQEIYVGRGRNKDKYSYDCDNLSEKINQRLAEYKPEEIFYFKSIGKGLGGLFGAMPKEGTHEAKFAEKLKIIGTNIYERSKPDVMTIDKVVDFLGSRNINEMEIIGVDANCSITLTTVTATNEYNINVTYNTNCIVFPTPEKSAKLREKFKRNRVTLL